MSMPSFSAQAKKLQLGTYKHYKGNLYEVLGVGMHESTHEELVIYQDAKDEHLWVRPLSEFTAKVKNEGKELPRFKYLGF